MPTNKARINITASEDVTKALRKLAKRDNTSTASKALELIRHALEIEEDAALLTIATEREKEVKKSEYLDHEDVWG